MPVLEWDEPKDKRFETGLDRGVLYVNDSPLGGAFAWNGLIEVTEIEDRSSSPIFYNGINVGSQTKIGNFKAKLRAYTYPSVLDYLSGSIPINDGVFVGEQHPVPFSMSYRTRVGNSAEGDTAGYKIHVLQNLIAIPSDTSYETSSDDPSLVEFEWDLISAPDWNMPALRPTSHMVIHTAELDPLLLFEIETILYGGQYTNAVMPPLRTLVEYIGTWYRIRIVDNQDGTWTASTNFDGYIIVSSDGTFRIDNANAIYIDDNSYVITGTKSIKDAPTMAIVDNGNGTWTASTSDPNLINLEGNDVVSINGAEVVYLDAETYTISSSET